MKCIVNEVLKIPKLISESTTGGIENRVFNMVNCCGS